MVGRVALFQRVGGWLLGGGLALVCAGCARGCRRESHPYVPYTVQEEREAATVPPPPLDAPSPRSVEAGAQIPPAEATAWTLEGLPLQAPEGFVFVLGRVMGVAPLRVALAWVAERSDGAARVCILYREREGGEMAPPERLAVSPLSARIECTRELQILPLVKQSEVAQEGGLAGLPSVLLEDREVCPSSLPTERWIGVYRLGSPVREQLSARVVDPVESPPLQTAVDGSDLDQDGLPDLTVRFSLLGAASSSPSVSVRWFDRPAGMSRDPSEPAASFVRWAQQLALRAARAAKPALWQAVRREAEQFRALYQALCTEGGEARFRSSLDPEGLVCGAQAAWVDTLLLEGRASLAEGDLEGSSQALLRVQRVQPTSPQLAAFAQQLAERMPAVDVEEGQSLPEATP